MRGCRASRCRALAGAIGTAAVVWALVGVCGCDGCGHRGTPASQPAGASTSLGRLPLGEPDDEPELSLAEIAFRSCFQDHCAKCHKKRYEPGHFTDKQWRGFLPRHARKTRADAQAADRILQWMVDHN